ncbi:MAG: hypothetical protein K2O18_17145 [Oscillospiraceae bacterium]|nr:hypothetical protein [Oscillospiraceae bacterium]
MFRVGELIVYGGEGVCRVEAVGPLAMSGVDEKDRLYYTLAPLYRMGEIYTPVDTTVLMRPVLSKKEAEELIRIIPEIQPPAHTERNPRVLGAYYQEIIRSHNCLDMVRLIKTTYKKSQARLAHGSKPGQVDERYRKRAEDLLYGELAVALNISREEVGVYFAKAVGE